MNIIIIIIVTDYVPFVTTIIIPRGQTSASYIATIRNDRIPEPTESFMVRMSTVSGSMVTVSSIITISITDSDSELLMNINKPMSVINLSATQRRYYKLILSLFSFFLFLSSGSVIRYSPIIIARFEENRIAPLRIIVVPNYFETFMFESFSVEFRDANDLATSKEEGEREREIERERERKERLLLILILLLLLLLLLLLSSLL